jgi:hypothetical protein
MIQVKTVVPLTDGLGVPTEWTEVKPWYADPPGDQGRRARWCLMLLCGCLVTRADGVATGISLTEDHTRFHVQPAA